MKPRTVSIELWKVTEELSYFHVTNGEPRLVKYVFGNALAKKGGEVFFEKKKKLVGKIISALFYAS